LVYKSNTDLYLALSRTQLLTYILGTKTSSDNPVVFLLVDLVSLSKQRFEKLRIKAHDVKAFFDKVQKLYTTKDIGNPFMDVAFAERNLSCSS
jgi:hypothetical protein